MRRKSAAFYPGNSRYNTKVVFPYLRLTKIDWDDKNYKTTYNLHFYQNEKKSLNIGRVKILDKRNRITDLQKQFKKLDSRYFCSLGQNIDYYKNLRTIKEYVNTEALLNGLNDITYNFGLRENFENEQGFKNSLIRDNDHDAIEALNHGYSVYRGELSEKDFGFTYSCQLKNALGKHEVYFNFQPKILLPGRVFSIVGKNGTGKTQYLAKLASALVSQRKPRELEYDKLDKSLTFRKVIAISYSIFDKFKISKSNKRVAYKYFGVRDKRGKTNEIISNKKLIQTIELLENKLLFDTWLKHVKNVLNLDSEEIIHEYLRTLRSNRKLLKEKSIESILSSGQILLLQIIAQIISEISENTLILFDEPETHLHPNALSQLIRILHDILKENDSFAIIATHSPIVLQEIPSKFIKVFKREENYPFITEPEIETFGGNLTEITEKVFDIRDFDGNYKVYFRNLSNKKSYEEILSLFNNRLSLNAKIYLKNLYK